MLSFFRRLIHSKVGVIVTLGILAVIALAFAAGDITGVRQGSGSVLGGSIAEVGKTRIGEADMRTRVQSAFAVFRQQQPTLDMAGFVEQGGLTGVIDRTINGLALQEFGEAIGMHIGKLQVDGEIASIPVFHGLNGQFSQQTYEAVLQQQRLTDRQVREDIARDLVARNMLAPTMGAAQVPEQLALPYASLLLERRQGSVGYIPAAAVPAGAAPTDAEVQQWYTRQRARYSVPERRSVRYAVVRAADVSAGARPTDAEVAQAYDQQKARFAASEKRDLAQVIVLDRATADALAARVKGGTPIAAAARAQGLEPNVRTGIDKAAFARASSQAAADAAFAAAPGAVVGPVPISGGFAVIKVEKVETVPARSLDQVRGELVAELTKRKAAQALADIHDKLDDAAADGSTFDELVADAKLKGQTSPALIASGINPDQPTPQPDPLFQKLAQAAFLSEQGDAPQLITIDPDGSFAVVAVGQVQPAAPRPLAQIRDQVAKDFAADRAFRAARAAAQAVVAKADKGTPLAQALQQTGYKLPPVQQLNVSRGELARAGQQLPPPVTLLFSMAAKRAKLVEAPNRAGWFVVWLDAIQSGNARGNAQLLGSTRAGIGGVVGREYAEQFTNAVRAQVGVKRNEAAIAKLRSDLLGGGPAN